jgi:hypothetical protein
LRILVGCPVRQREWSLPHWLAHVENSFIAAGVTPEYVFVSDPRDPSLEVIKRLCTGRLIHFVEISEDISNVVREHKWGTESALRHMTFIRNLLLRTVRELEPEAFLSLDSDILITPDTLKNLRSTLLEDEREFDAVGGKCYLGVGVDNISWGRFSESSGLQRSDAVGVFPVDVIMAIKLMSPAAFAVDYQYHHNGEDVGWSMACKQMGLRLGWDGREACKHVMTQVDDQGESMITKFDPRCGF